MEKIKVLKIKRHEANFQRGSVYRVYILLDNGYMVYVIITGKALSIVNGNEEMMQLACLCDGVPITTWNIEEVRRRMHE